MTATDAILAAALDYAAAGIEVFPARPNKAPYTANGMKDATCDPDQIRAWWRQWPDALVAARVPAGVVIIDIDPKHGGDRTWRALLELHGPPTPTRRHKSGRNDGGGHLWFQRPDGHLSTKKLDAWAKEHGHGETIADGRRHTAGIDLLHHGHRYSILPPSPHPETGSAYEWRGDGPNEPIRPCPTWLARLITADPPEPPADWTPPPEPDPDSPADWYTATYTWGDLLRRHGWTLVQGDGETDGSGWRHPQATSSLSATIRHGCLFCYTPNTPFEPTTPDYPVGYTLFRAFAELDHCGDMSEAAKAAKALRGDPEPQPLDWSVLVPEPAGLDDTFWTARPALAAIRQAAQARRVSPAAALAAVLARIAAFTPPERCLPPIIGGTVPLSLYTNILAPTGGGKSSTGRVAADLLPATPPGCIDGQQLGTGEGLAELFLEHVDEKDDDGKTVRVKKQTRHGAYLVLDEGRVLGEVAARRGSTILPTLCSAWVGATLGQANASQDTHRHLPGGGYAIGLVTAWQPAAAASLFDDTDGGLPGRFLYVPATDPGAPDVPPPWPGPLDWTPPARIHVGGTLTLADEIIIEVDDARVAELRGIRTPHPLDAHRNLLRLKVAGLLAVLDGRTDVGLDDWELSTAIVEASDAARQAVLDELARVEREKSQASIRAHVSKAAAAEEDRERRALEACARAAARRAHKVGEPLKYRDLLAAMASDRKRECSTQDAVALAVARGWIVETADGYVAGESKPT